MQVADEVKTLNSTEPSDLLGSQEVELKIIVEIPVAVLNKQEDQVK